MFKIIFNHLYSQTINKPSITSKFNKWSLSKSDININKFENTVFFYRKELLNTKINLKKNINYNKFFFIESIFIFYLLICLFLIVIMFTSIFLNIIKTEAFITSLQFSLFFLLTNTVIFKLVIIFLSYIFIYYLIINYKQYSLTKFKLIN